MVKKKTGRNALLVGGGVLLGLAALAISVSASKNGTGNGNGNGNGETFCTPGDQVCFNDDVMRCNSSGSAYDEFLGNCAAGCENGECLTCRGCGDLANGQSRISENFIVDSSCPNTATKSDLETCDCDSIITSPGQCLDFNDLALPGFSASLRSNNRTSGGARFCSDSSTVGSSSFTLNLSNNTGKNVRPALILRRGSGVNTGRFDRAYGLNPMSPGSIQNWDVTVPDSTGFMTIQIWGITTETWLGLQQCSNPNSFPKTSYLGVLTFTIDHTNETIRSQSFSPAQ